ncbi:MAG: hypothetical protein DHS20C14_00650 [Phycisphaeraceae bacterium]|nr:MAG: hypothetical protein DHS20C14_00650 [Phycisphaeraceae bacterium]
MTAVVMDILQGVARRAEQSGVFGAVEVQGGRLACAAKASAEPAFYRLSPEGDALWVELVTPDRWLSGSIEGDLIHTGDKLEELLDEELADLGHDGPVPTYEHFRSEDMLFTFRTRVPQLDEETAARFLLAYEQCFRNLGDMEEGTGDD